MRPERILSIQVDGIYCQPQKWAHARFCQQLANMTYKGLHKHLRGHLDGYLGTCRQKDMTSEALVYKVTDVAEPTYPGGTLAIADHVEAPVHKELRWNVLEEGNDRFLDDVVLPHVASGRSCCILGPPGTGKSVCLRRIYEMLDCPVKRLSLSHAAARNIQGETTHSFIARHVMYGTYKGVVLLDEISNQVLPLLAALDVPRLGDCRIISFGDFNQLPPISNSWRGDRVADDAFEHSRLFKCWSDCSQFRLTTARRCDREHYQFYTTLPMDLGAAIARLTQRHPRSSLAKWNLVVSNARRRAINQKRQKTEARGRATVEVPAGDDPPYPLFVGTGLIGYATNKKFTNGAFYTCREIGEKVVVQDDSTGEPIETTTEELAQCTQLRWAMTYSKAQGQTLDGTVALWDLRCPHFCRKHLYVGASRVKHGSLLFANL